MTAVNESLYDAARATTNPPRDPRESTPTDATVCRRAGDDLFFPLAPAPPALRAETAYDSESFGAAVSEMARSIASTYRSADRPDELGG